MKLLFDCSSNDLFQERKYGKFYEKVERCSLYIVLFIFSMLMNFHFCL